MLNYRGSRNRTGFTVPFLKQASKHLQTLQGKYIFYIIIICSLIGFIIQQPISNTLKEHEMSSKGRELNQIEAQTMSERATLIAMVVTVCLLILLILSMGYIIRIFERRSMENSIEEEHY
jgi:beta-lactamase regulating signal transducer with metallopeptidase domain